jgi:isocitrate dehydrogenase kinase/phosphatase
VWASHVSQAPRRAGMKYHISSTTLAYHNIYSHLQPRQQLYTDFNYCIRGYFIFYFIVDYALLTMSDATLPSLPPPSHEDSTVGKSPRSSSSGNDVFPFLVHSQESVTNGDPPEVDNGRLARQKRRRTRYVMLCLVDVACRCVGMYF